MYRSLCSLSTLSFALILSVEIQFQVVTSSLSCKVRNTQSRSYDKTINSELHKCYIDVDTCVGNCASSIKFDPILEHENSYYTNHSAKCSTNGIQCCTSSLTTDITLTAKCYRYPTSDNPNVWGSKVEIHEDATVPSSCSCQDCYTNLQLPSSSTDNINKCHRFHSYHP